MSARPPKGVQLGSAPPRGWLVALNAAIASFSAALLYFGVLLLFGAASGRDEATPPGSDPAAVSDASEAGTAAVRRAMLFLDTGVLDAPDLGVVLRTVAGWTPPGAGVERIEIREYRANGEAGQASVEVSARARGRAAATAFVEAAGGGPVIRESTDRDGSVLATVRAEVRALRGASGGGDASRGGPEPFE